MRSALKWGALVGVATYLVVGLGLDILGNLVAGPSAASLEANPSKLVLGCSQIFLLFFAFSAAGFLAGYHTRKAGLGAVAGMVAFAVYGPCTALYLPSSAASPATTASAGSTAGQIISTIIAGAVVLGIAAMMGWLGGRPGAQRAERRTLAHAGVVEARPGPVNDAALS